MGTAVFDGSFAPLCGIAIKSGDKNSDGNVAHNCNLLSYNSSGNIVAVKGEKLIVMDGIKDYIIADTGDVLLLCPKAQEQRIKQMVNDIKQLFNGRYL